MTKSDYDAVKTGNSSGKPVGARVFHRGAKVVHGTGFQRPFYWVPRRMGPAWS